MPAVPDLTALAQRIDRHADEADARGSHERADELRRLATALRAKHAQRAVGRITRRRLSA